MVLPAVSRVTLASILSTVIVDFRVNRSKGLLQLRANRVCSSYLEVFNPWELPGFQWLCFQQSRQSFFVDDFCWDSYLLNALASSIKDSCYLSVCWCYQAFLMAGHCGIQLTLGPDAYLSVAPSA